MKPMINTWRRARNRWNTWNLPTRLGLAIGAAGISLSLLGFSVKDLIPVVHQWVSHQDAPNQESLEIPLLTVIIKNASKANEIVPYRGTVFIWLPGAGARYVPGTYEIVSANGVAIQDATVSVPAVGTTHVRLRIMNSKVLYRYLEAGDCEITLFFRNSEGAMFDSGEIPFTKDAVKKYYATTDITPK